MSRCPATKARMAHCLQCPEHSACTVSSSHGTRMLLKILDPGLYGGSVSFSGCLFLVGIVLLYARILQKLNMTPRRTTAVASVLRVSLVKVLLRADC